MSVLYLTTATLSVPIPGHNGGVLQTNLGAPGYSGDFVYLNVIKLFQGFYTSITGATYVPITMYNRDGYPNSTFDYVTYGGCYSVGYIPSQEERPGDYMVTWSGTGTIYCPNHTAPIGGSGSKSISGFTFTPNAARITIGISAGTNISNLQAFHVDDLPNITAGEKFGVKFLEKFAEGGYGRLRFMDWQSGNFGGLAQWKYRCPQTHICPAFYDARADLFAGATTNVGDAYTITSFVDPYYGTAAPVHGQTFFVQWSATAVTEDPTLQINGHGPYPILHQSGRKIFAGAGASSRPGIGRTHTLIYDANFNSFLCYGSPSSNIYLDNGLPYEDMIELCNLVGAHPHFISPTATASDGPTDFYAELAALCQSQGGAWMKPAFETNNEIFTTAFNATEYSKQIFNRRNQAGTIWTNTAATWTGVTTTGVTTLTFTGSAPPIGTFLQLGTYSGPISFSNQQCYVTEVNVGGDPLKVKVNRAPNGPTGNPWSGSTNVLAVTAAGASHDWVGRIASMLGQQISAAYGDDRTKYAMLVGVQTGLAVTSGEVCAQRIDSLQYVLQAGGSPAYLWVTEGTCAQYVNPGVYNSNAEMIAAYNYYTTGTISIVADYVDTMGNTSGTSSPDGYTLPRMTAMWNNWRTFFKARGIMKLSGYEGGYSSNFMRTTDATTVITSPVSGVTNATSAVVTLATSNWPSGVVEPGPAVNNTCVGFMVALTGLVGPTALNCTVGPCTFANGSATITRTNTFIAGQMALFTTNNTLPTGTGFGKNTPLYIVNPTGTTFQVSTTKGGAAIVFNTTGQLGTHTVQSGWRVLGVSGNNVTLDVDTSNTTTYPAWVSGGVASYINGRIMLNKLRADAKQCVSSPVYPASGMKGWSKAIFNGFLDNSADPTFSKVFGSQYLFCASVSLVGSGDYGDASVWGGLNDTIWTTLPCPMHYACAEINAASRTKQPPFLRVPLDVIQRAAPGGAGMS